MLELIFWWGYSLDHVDWCLIISSEENCSSWFPIFDSSWLEDYSVRLLFFLIHNVVWFNRRFLFFFHFFFCYRVARSLFSFFFSLFFNDVSFKWRKRRSGCKKGNRFNVRIYAIQRHVHNKREFSFSFLISSNIRRSLIDLLDWNSLMIEVFLSFTRNDTMFSIFPSDRSFVADMGTSQLFTITSGRLCIRISLQRNKKKKRRHHNWSNAQQTTIINR